jgi:hypothetical protein
VVLDERARYGPQVAAMPVVRFRLGATLVAVSVHNHALQLFITGEETKARIEQL